MNTQGGQMKRIYLMFLLMLPMIIASGCSLAENISEIEIVNLADGEKTVMPAGSENAAALLKAIKAKDKTQENISGLPSYELLMKKNSDTDSYILSIDLNGRKAYVSREGSSYIVDDKVAGDLLLNESFSYIYVNSTLYDAFLDYNEDLLETDRLYDWTYRNSRGDFVKKEGKLKGKLEGNSVKIGKGDTLDIAYEKTPDSQAVKAYSQGKLIGSGAYLNDVLAGINFDGEYEIESHAQWLMRSDSQFYGNQTLSFKVAIDRDADISVITRENSPGNILLVSAENLNSDETLKISTDVVKTDTNMYSYNGKNIFICPIDLYAQPGEHKLTAVINEGTDREYTIEKTFTVSSKTFKTQYLTVSNEMNETNNDDTAIYEFAKLVKPARTESSPEKLWEGTFDIPVEGRLTTDFAEIRFVNNVQSSSRHSGLDLAAPLGTEIKAPNNGIVVFAMEGLMSPGNTVVIDHGMGLFTSYYHMDKILAQKGQKVSKGEVIGTVGTTGFSTGPHLHYAVSIYNVYVNPYQPLSGIID